MDLVTNLASKVSGTTLRDLQDDGAVLVAGGLESSYHSGRGGDVLAIMLLRVGLIDV